MKIAVIGSGISGLGTALILSEKHDVELFEADSRLGGHAHTVNVLDSTSKSIAVDTGFLVYNELTYPHFTKMMEYLNVETVDSDMSLSIQTDNGIQWAGTNLNSVFAQKWNILNPKFIKMLWDITKFHKQADENLNLAKENSWTLKDLIAYRKLSDSFVNWYLLPMTGAIWSMSYQKALEFPAASFMQFCINHRLLQVNDRPIWRTVKNGSVNYVNKIAEKLKKIHLNSEVSEILKQNNKLIVVVGNKKIEFDKVVLATSAPITYRIIKNNFPSIAENFIYANTSKNKVVLHQDEKIMPTYKNCWSTWNVKAKNNLLDKNPIELTYYLNKLQPLQTKDTFLISLNHPDKFTNTKREFIYEHPQFDFSMYELQKQIPKLQGQDNLYFAGAWTRYGFHEDGLLSAVNVAKSMGVETPWKI